MKSALLFVLMMLSCSASAAWTEVTENDVGDTYFIDLASIRVDGQKRTVWRLTNFKMPIQKYYSARNRATYDCVRETKTILTTTYFTQRNLKGDSVTDEPSGKVIHVAPNTVDADIMQLVCSR
jgi:hypothetical protein